MDLNSALNSLLDDEGLGLKPKKTMGSMKNMAATKATKTMSPSSSSSSLMASAGTQPPMQKGQQQQQYMASSSPPVAGGGGLGGGIGGSMSPAQVSRSASAQSVGLSSLSTTSSADDLFGLEGGAQGVTSFAPPAAAAAPTMTQQQQQPGSSGSGQDLDDFFSGMGIGNSATPTAPATPTTSSAVAVSGGDDLLGVGGFASGAEMAVPEAATTTTATAGDEWRANEAMRQGQMSGVETAPEAPASAAGSVVVNDVDDDAAFGPGGPLETEDYASARASFEERRRRNECIRHQQEEFDRYERSQAQQSQPKMQERLRESRDRMGSFLNNMKNSLVSNAREKINNFKASRSMTEHQQQQLQSRPDGGPKITQVAPSPAHMASPRVLVEGESSSSPSAAAPASPVQDDGYSDFMGSDSDQQQSPRSDAGTGSDTASAAGASANTDDALDIFATSDATEASTARAAPAAATANDDINALFAEPAPPPAAAQSGFDDIFGNNGVDERGGGGGGGGVSFGFEAAASSGPNSANTVAVDANNVVLVSEEQGTEGEPEIRKRLREQRIQKKKAAMAAALQQKLDKDMEEAMERAEVRLGLRCLISVPHVCIPRVHVYVCVFVCVCVSTSLTHMIAVCLYTTLQCVQRDEVAEYKGPKIKAWAARHKDNIRGLLGTLHEVLWSDSGWVPVQVTDLIEPKRVKMSFRKAMLRVHPDKVKSNGGNVEQCYIADQVFDTLNQAYTKFEKEEMK